VGREAAQTPSRACASQHVRRRRRRQFKGLYIQGEDIAQSDPNTQHVTGGAAAMECVVVQDLFLNETAKLRARLPAGLVVPREGRHLHQRRAPHLARAQGDAPKPAMADWEITMLLANALGYPMHYKHPSRDHGRDRALTPTFAGVSFAKLDELGSIQWPCNDKRRRHAVMHIGGFVRGKGKFVVTEYVPTDERSRRRASRCC
jgi:formate dehydrogenase major subunit